MIMIKWEMEMIMGRSYIIIIIYNNDNDCVAPTPGAEMVGGEVEMIMVWSYTIASLASLSLHNNDNDND